MKIDLIGIEKNIYQPSSETPEIVKVPGQIYLVFDESINRKLSDKFIKTEILLKSISKRARNILRKLDPELDYKILPVEKTSDQRTQIRQPEFLTMDILKMAIQEELKRPEALPKIESQPPGLFLQILIDPKFHSETVQIRKLNSFLKNSGYRKCGSLRRIYLENSTSGKMIILRQPVKKEI